MDLTIRTARLKLNLVTAVERGSEELSRIHELLSNEKITFWSIRGVPKSIDDTEQHLKKALLHNGEPGSYRVVYAVYKVLEPSSKSRSTNTTTTSAPEATASGAEQQEPSEFIGLINLVSLDGDRLALPPHLTLPASAAATTLSLELAYNMTPSAWGKGYGTEAIGAMLEACTRTKQFWKPYEKLYVRAIVNEANPGSQRVMEKVGMTRLGVFEWKGDEAIFVAGQWRTTDRIVIFGKHLLQ